MPTIDPRDRSITLTVQASKLFNLKTKPTEEQMDDYTSLLEDGGLESRFGDANKDFETIVFMQKDICWSIKASAPSGVDEGYSIGLVQVYHDPKPPGNPNFFTSESLPVDEKTGKVCGTIANNPDLPNKDDSYIIQFSIGYSTPNTSAIRLFNLDPKLKINAKQ